MGVRPDITVPLNVVKTRISMSLEGEKHLNNFILGIYKKNCTIESVESVYSQFAELRSGLRGAVPFGNSKTNLQYLNPDLHGCALMTA